MRKPKPLTTQGDRLKAAREAAGYRSAPGAALALGMSSSTYGSKERAGYDTTSSREINAKQAKFFAEKFGVDAGWLLTGEGRGPKPTPDQVTLHERDGDEPTDGGHIDSAAILSDADNRPHIRAPIRVVGYVGAGNQAHYYGDGDVTEIDGDETVDFSLAQHAVAVEIRGRSFGPLLDGWLVVYDDVHSPVTPDLIGSSCVVGLTDGRVLLKSLKQERDGSFSLISNSSEPPIQNADIVWAAKVRSIRPRS